MTRVLRRLFVSSSDISGVEGDQRARSGCFLPPPAAKVAFPALIARYCKGGNGWEGQGHSWLDSDESTCTALELDVHALAMLVFVEWREFVSALPGCGAALSRETSALWFAQVVGGCCHQNVLGQFLRGGVEEDLLGLLSGRVAGFGRAR